MKAERQVGMSWSSGSAGGKSSLEAVTRVWTRLGQVVMRPKGGGRQNLEQD